MASRWVVVAAAAALAGCGGQGVDEADPPLEGSDGRRYSVGYDCTGLGDWICGCDEHCLPGDPQYGEPDSCQPLGYSRPDGEGCGALSSACWGGVCCQDWMSCPDDGKACTRTQCAADGVTCTYPEYCPPRNACDTGNGRCGVGDTCDYSLVYRGDGASCGTSVWCFAELCRPGCYLDNADGLGALYREPGALRPGNGCQHCDPATSRTAWSAVLDGTACGSGRVCDAGTCKDGCLVGGTLYALGDRNPGNECQACAAASADGWTNTTDPCTDDGDPCTVDHCAGDGTCGHYPDPSACSGPTTDSMFGCSSGSGAGLPSLLLVVWMAPLRRRRARGLLLAALLAGPVLATAAPPSSATANPKAKTTAPAPKASASPAPPVAPAPAPPEKNAPAPGPRRPSDEIAIFTFKAGPEVSEQTAALVTQAFGAALHERGIPTLSEEDVKTALGFEKQRQMLGCDTEGCFAEIGGALGVRRMVSGSLGRLGDSLVLNAQLVDVRHASVERRHTARRPISSGDAAYLEAVPELVEALFPLGPEAGLERRLAIAAGGLLELHGDPGGAGRLLARWAFRPWLRAAAGFLVAPERVGATARLDWIPWRPERRLHPVASLELLALSADPLSPGVGLSVGAEWRVTPRFDLAVELPVVRLFAVPDGMRETYVFAALTAAWRL